ncbi:MAG TPA: hypothetical protein VKQ30_07700 [Ktedonobacterales bacterium]|nr:hypothetical protein [Ktedonobacterales bacterium]
MGEREPPDFFSERFDLLRPVQEALERRGYFFYPIEKEHTEGLVTAPLLHRLHTTIKKRGFGNVAAHVALTFSGFSRDPREVYEIPEARDWWRALDAQLPELPALLASLPEFRYNGPSMQLTMLGTIDQAVQRPEIAVRRARARSRGHHRRCPAPHPASWPEVPPERHRRAQFGSALPERCDPTAVGSATATGGPAGCPPPRRCGRLVVKGSLRRSAQC